MRFDFPDELRPATVEERERFYREQFPADLVRSRMERWDRFVPVIDVGSETTRYKPRFKEYKGKLLRLTDWETVDDLHDKLVEYAPEDVYYLTRIEKEDRVEVDPEQELVFDLDPENTDCERCERRKKYLDRPARDYVFCQDCFRRTAAFTRQLADFLATHFSDLDIVYSGRGFHIHVMDDAAFQLDREDRRELAGKVAKKFPIDPDVTSGETDLVRLPGSLHGLVSRIVTRVDADDLADPDRIMHDAARPMFVDTP